MDHNNSLKHYNVVIVGGGTSGTMAAIAAGRGGASVLLIEKNGFLGGVMTGAGVGPMMTFHAGDTQVIQGIMGEMVDKLVEKGYSPGHIDDSTGFTYSVTPFDAEGMKIVEETMVLESGCDILYHSMLAEVQVVDRAIRGITICNKHGLVKVSGDVFIDATGDADLSAWAGVPFSKGREADGAMQPVTLMLKMNHVDIAAIKDYVEEHPEEFPRLNGDTEQVVKANRLSIAGFHKHFLAGKNSGELTTDREDILFFETNTPGEVIFNTTRVLGCDGTDPLSLTQAEIGGRRQAMEIADFALKHLPGFGHAKVVQTGPSIGVRGSRQIIGHYTLTAQDLMMGKTFDDCIAVGGYPIDIHSPDGEGTQVQTMPWGHQYQIPYRCLTNHVVDNLITVGRCISADFEAQAAVRVSPIIGAVGEAGGTAAAMMIKEKLSQASDLKASELRKKLRSNGGYLI